MQVEEHPLRGWLKWWQEEEHSLQGGLGLRVVEQPLVGLLVCEVVVGPLGGGSRWVEALEEWTWTRWRGKASGVQIRWQGMDMRMGKMSSSQT